MFQPWRYNPYTPFGPVVEKSTENYFINRSPIEIIVSGDVQDVPWITGVVSEEGLYPVAGKYNLQNKYYDMQCTCAMKMKNLQNTLPMTSY